MNVGVALTVSLLILVANAFFVAAEFALVAAKEHRLEQAADAGSRGAAQAIQGLRKLSMMLAGAQLGITLCTVALGALAKPAVASLFATALGWARVPEAVAGTIAFLLAVCIVAFLHVVVGEMAPKSWAITTPEVAATWLSIPFMAFVAACRPLLAAMNAVANAMVRAAGYTPQDTLAQVHGPQELRVLIAASREQGTLVGDQGELLTAVLDIGARTVAEVMTPASRIVAVPVDASSAEIEAAAVGAGLSRLCVRDDADGIVGIVHIKDAVVATTTGSGERARDLMMEAVQLPPTASLRVAVDAMRVARRHLAVVADPAGDVVGVVSMEDALQTLLGSLGQVQTAS